MTEIQIIDDGGEDNKDGLTVKHWHTELDISKRYRSDFLERAKDCVEEYTAGEPTGPFSAHDPRLRVFWANVETLKAGSYNQTPKADIRRRWSTKDRIARASAQILENATDNSLSLYDFDYMAQLVVQDRLVVGRGVSRVFYNATFEEAFEDIQLTAKKGKLFDVDGKEYKPEDPKALKPTEGGFVDQKPYQKKVYERVHCQYVAWADFAHNKARNWDEVRWVGFRAHLTRDELVKRFGADKVGAAGLRVPVQSKLDDGLAKDLDQSEQQAYQKAHVWEIWCKDTRKVYWVADGFCEYLDEQDDPYQLREFFPCPRPLQATSPSTDYLPFADYCYYKDQCGAINALVARRAVLIDALRIIAVADKADHPELEKLFSIDDPAVIGVSNFVAMAKKGGLQGALEFIPIEPIVSAISVIDQAIHTEQQRLYEIAGIPDVMRGQTDPLETARAQKIKAQYAERRVDTLVRDVARYFRDLVAILAELIAEQFEPDTIYQMAGVEVMQEEVTPEEYQAVIELLRDDVTRNYRLGIETDSTIALDEALEKESVGEFLSQFTPFMDKALVAMQTDPNVGRLAGRVLQFSMKPYKVGRGLEEDVENILEQMAQKAEQMAQQPPPPDPEMQKLQMQAQMKQQELQMKGQMEQAKQQMDFQFRDRELRTKEMEAQAAIERERIESQAQIEKVHGELAAVVQRLQGEMQKMQVDLATKGAELELDKQRLYLDAEKARGELEIKTAELQLKGMEAAPAVAAAQTARQRIARFMTDPQTGERMAVIEEVA